MADDRDKDRVSLDPLDPVTALKALLAVDPRDEPVEQDEPATRDEDESKPRDNA